MRQFLLILCFVLPACVAADESVSDDSQPDAGLCDNPVACPDDNPDAGSHEPQRSVAYPGAPLLCDALAGLISAEEYLRETFGDDACLHVQCGLDGPFLYACADGTAFTVTGYNVPEGVNETCPAAQAAGSSFSDLPDPTPAGPHAPTAINFPNAPQICDSIDVPDTLDPPFTATEWILDNVGCDACVHAQCGGDSDPVNSMWACAGCSEWGANSGRGLDQLVCGGY